MTNRRKTKTPGQSATPEPLCVNPANPASYPRRILFSVSGLTPQILTETLYALTQKERPAFVPTEIHLLTTALGADQAKKTLLGTDEGWFHALCREYGLPHIDFSEKNIHVIRDEDGQPCEDIRTEEDNEGAANQIVEHILRLTSDPNAALHVSLAGGRKTMGYYAGYALSLYGRPQDRLSHVLVSGPFEGHPRFFYPTKEERIIRTRDDLAVDTREAKVTLAKIPFVRMRPGLSEDLRRGKISFRTAVNGAQRSLQTPELLIDEHGDGVSCNGQFVRLTPPEFAFIAWFARRLVDGKPGVVRRRITEADTSGYIESGRAVLRQKTLNSLGKEMEPSFFDQRKSTLTAALVHALGSEAAHRYDVRQIGGKLSAYCLPLSPEQVRFAAIPDREKRMRRKPK